MAGNYPDVPAPRMAYDRDGTVVGFIDNNVIIEQLSTARMATLNDESDSKIYPSPTDYVDNLFFVFPQPREITGIFLATEESNVVSSMQYSTDTTNGVDGTWTAITTYPSPVQYAPVNYRNRIQAYALSNVKGLRFSGRSGSWSSGLRSFRAIHIYGSLTNYTGVDALRLWHPTLDEPLDDNTTADGAFFDWGDIPRGSTQNRTFRIKNNSASLTANSVIVNQQALTDTTPSVAAMYTFSNGGAYASSLDIGNLAPGTISGVITKQFSAPSNAVLSLWTSRTVATPTSWS